MTDDDRYLTLGGLVAYSTLSIRTLRRYMADARHPLPVHRLGGRVLFKRSEFDQWLRDHQDRASEIDHDEVRRVAREIRGEAIKHPATKADALQADAAAIVRSIRGAAVKH